MDERGHGADVAGDVAIDGVSGEQTVARGVDAGTGGGGVGGAVVEDAVAVVVGAGGDVVRRAGLRVHLRGEGDFLGKVELPKKKRRWRACQSGAAASPLLL